MGFMISFRWKQHLSQGAKSSRCRPRRSCWNRPIETDSPYLALTYRAGEMSRHMFQRWRRRREEKLSRRRCGVNYQRKFSAVLKPEILKQTMSATGQARTTGRQAIPLLMAKEIFDSISGLSCEGRAGASRSKRLRVRACRRNRQLFAGRRRCRLRPALLLLAAGYSNIKAILPRFASARLSS